MKRALTDINGFLVDLDGTTYISNTPTPGAVDFFTHCQATKKPYFFFSNNPTKNATEYVNHLTAMGIPATPEQIITSADATVQYVKKNNLRCVYSIGTPSFNGMLVTSGVTLSSEKPEALVISFDTTLTYEKLRIATQLLLANPSLPFIASNPDPICSPTDQGPLPDCGALIAFLKTATHCEPVVMGKPGPGMVDIASERSGLPAESFAIIGDRLATDMQMGFNHHVTTILLLTGDTTREHLAAAPRQPDYVYTDLTAVQHDLV